jgi:hypothetical protein
LAVDGDPDRPNHVGLLVVVDDALSPSSVAAWDDLWQRMAETALAHHPALRVNPNRYETLFTLTACDYLHSVLVEDFRLS